MSKRLRFFRHLMVAKERNLPNKTIRLLACACIAGTLLVGCAQTETPIAQADTITEAERETSGVFSKRLLEAPSWIQDTLDRDASSRFHDATLHEVVADLQRKELYEVPVIIDTRALAYIKFDIEQRFSGEFGGGSLRRGMQQFFRQCGLVVDYRFEQIIITTVRDAESWSDRTGVDELEPSPDSPWAKALEDETGVEYLTVLDLAEEYKKTYGAEVQLAQVNAVASEREAVTVVIHEVRRANHERLRILLGRECLTCKLDGNTLIISPRDG